MAVYFGQGATYESIKYQLRRHKRMAEDMRRNALENGVQIPRETGGNTTTRTPQAPRPAVARGGGSSSRTSKTGPYRDTPENPIQTPTKPGKRGAQKSGSNVFDPINLDEDEGKDDDNDNGNGNGNGNGEIDVNVKDEAAERQILDDLNTFVRFKAEKMPEDDELFVKQDDASSIPKAGANVFTTAATNNDVNPFDTSMSFDSDFA